MKTYHSLQFSELKSLVLQHHLKSGEIIISTRLRNVYPSHDIDEIRTFFDHENIETEEPHFELVNLPYKEATESIKYGLSTKLNYTKIEKEFTDEDRTKYAREFLSFFCNAKLYQLNTRIKQSNIPFDDFWETGGVIAIDKSLIGIFWINDLYDYGL